jgi:hypothetical protein
MDIFTGIFGLLMGCLAIWISIRFIKLYFGVKSWLRMDANVVSKEVGLHKTYSNSRSPYKVSANYLYVVSGKEYSGSLIYLVELMNGKAGHMKKTADAQLEKIKDHMEIYVDPKNNSRSVMFCEGIALYSLTFLIGIFALLFGLNKLM